MLYLRKIEVHLSNELSFVAKYSKSLIIPSFYMKIFFSKDIFQNNYFIILRCCGLIGHVAWSFIFLEKCDQATVTIKHRCWHQLVLDMTWYEDEFDFNMIKQRCQLNTDVDINWLRAWNDKKINWFYHDQAIMPTRYRC